MDVGNSLGMVERPGLTSFECDRLSMSEYLFARGEREFVDQLNGLGLVGIVLDLGFDEDGVASSIVPDVDTKRLDTDGIGLDERDRTENTERLAALAEPPFRRATAANPW